MGDSANSDLEPLRILMTTDVVGGVWRYSIDLARELARRGAQILLATLGPRPSEEQRREALDIGGLRLEESDFRLEWMADAWTDVDAAGRWLLDLEAGFHPDVIHLNGYSHAALNWTKPKLVVAHSCVFSWWRAVHGTAPGAEWGEYKRRVSAGLAAAGVIVAPSEAMAAALACEYGLSRQDIRVIHNFSGVSYASGGQKERFILASGRIWDKAKNIALLDSIATQVDWEIRVSGAKHARTEGREARFLGFLSRQEMLFEMARAGIFAHPALYEPFGLSVLEAANAGCCLVLSDIPSLRELWGGAAVFADPCNPAQWVKELNALARDPVTRSKWAELGRSHASKFRADQSAPQYEELYRFLIDSRSKSGKEAAA